MDPRRRGGRPLVAQADPSARYRVTAVQVMTGVPASTLRSWERRYGWPQPARTASDQRLYSDRDVAVVRFLQRRRAEGMSMAQATGLLDLAGAAVQQDPETVLPGLVTALRAFDELAAERAFATGERLLGAEGVVRELIPRTIAEVLTGDESNGDAVEVEHFASNFLRRQALRLLCGLPLPLGRPLLVACGPDEQHELGALLLTLLLRGRGHRVVYLGARLPGWALERAVARLDPVGVAISHTMPDSLEQSVAWARGWVHLHGDPPRLWWGGAATTLVPDLPGRLPVTILPGPVDQGAHTIDLALKGVRN
ncbi:MAG TPA: MerR family transcriptional regulator [Actinomycetota bacterium]|nr:MerR family transcriptional regulator [Actinomycetota bacterium]